jgi:exopolyphosphatase/guanosine-5'-triphosphate,3'-diphosphate pyrophosphatase
VGEIAAAIDIGTNAVLLLIAEWRRQKLKILRDEARITRLGEGLHNQPLFLPEAQERTFRVLKEYKDLCGSLNVKEIAAVGTAAFRKARNAPDFIARVEKELGFRIEIISGEDEARLSYLSVETDFPQYKNLIALDIGGGSTEIIWKEGAVSLDLGAVVLTERIVKHDPPTEDEIEALVKEIDRVIASVGAGFKPAPTLVGLAGSVTTLSAIKQKLAVWDGARVQGSILTSADLEEMIALFRRTTNEERRSIVGMVRGREDTILAGTLILKKVMEKLGVEEVTVSDRGLRYGLFYQRWP